MLKKTLSIARTPSALVAVTIFFLAGMVVWPQAQPPATYQPLLISFNSAPFGACDVYQVALNVSNGGFSSCNPLTHTWVSAANPAANINFTGADLFSQQITSTVSTGTAPFSIASTTVVPNLNAQVHGGLSAPASAIVGISDSQNLSNKTFTGASNGNTVTLLCSSGPAAAITGNGSAQTFESCTIPANAVSNLKALRVTAVWSHSTGTATVTYGMTLNGVALWPSNNTASTANGISQSALIIETASTTGNVLTPQGFFSLTANSLTGLSWTAGQTLAVTFNVANTDQITPLFFLVELIQ